MATALAALALAAMLLAPSGAAAESAGARTDALLAGRVDAGHSFNCAIAGNGSVRCWGFNPYGQLGYGNTTYIGDNESPASAGPVDLGGHTAIALATGNSHACAILDDGTVRCWGYNESGQLGYGNTQRIGDNESPASAGPVDLGPGRTAIAITAGQLHTCVVLDDRSVRCWGRGAVGILGYGGTENIGDDELPTAVPPVNLGQAAVAISAGTSHTCAILEDRTVRCWGAGSVGQLGYGLPWHIGDDEAPASQSPVSLGGRAVAISAGGDHTCVILASGGLRCWGGNNFGELGLGHTERIGDYEQPSSAPLVDLGDRRAVQVASGARHTCVALDDGTVRCWGDGSLGRLGYGNTTSIGDNETTAGLSALDLGGRGAIAVIAGEDHTCALLDDGTMRCWGESVRGQLGYGNTVDIGDDEAAGAGGSVALGADYGSGTHATSVAAGGRHTCALLDDGTVRCWGDNLHGQLGYGNKVAIGDDEAAGAAGPVSLGADRRAKAIAAGDSHTCALLDDGTVRCWGSGAEGRLGLGSTADVGDNELPSSVAPVALGGRSAVAVTAGGSHTCALLDDGGLKCWGNNWSGELGYGNTVAIGDDETPDAVGTVDLDGAAVAVDTGEFHTCALREDAALLCWGMGSFGALGYGSTAPVGDSDAPWQAGSVPIGEGAHATGASAGGNHTCAIVSTATVRCWGQAGSGQLGLGDTTQVGDDEPADAVPSVDLAGDNALSVAAGGFHTCAIVAGNRARCWGLNSRGQLGYGHTERIGDDESPGSVGVVSLGAARHPLLLAAGDYHSCALLDDGTIRCWGEAAAGALGYGSEEDIGDDETPDGAAVDLVDDAPVGVDDSATVAEDAGPVAIDVLGNDADSDGGAMTIDSVTQPEHGGVVVAGDGLSLTYQPDPDYCGPDSFEYSLAPGGSTATVAVEVTCLDDAPVGVDDSATVAEDAGPVAIDVLGNDADSDGGAMTIGSVTQPEHGSVVVAGDGLSLTYQPDPDYCGPDSFEYSLAPGGSTATVAVEVTCLDDAPVGVDDSATVAEDAGPVAIDVLGNDADSDGGAMTIDSVTQPEHGGVVVAGDGLSLTYQPDPDYCGPDTFEYALAPGGSTATVAVEVTCLDDAPVGVDDSATVLQDSVAQTIDVLANDTDADGGPKSIVAKTNGSHGAVTIAPADAGLAYTPDPGYCGPDSFTYTLQGGSTATVVVDVLCVPPAPKEEVVPGPAPDPVVSRDGPSPRLVEITPSVAVVSGRDRPRIAIKGAYASFELSCTVQDGPCAGRVAIVARPPGKHGAKRVKLVDRRYRVPGGRSALVRAKLTRRGLKALAGRPDMRRVRATMAIAEGGGGQRGEVEVLLVKRPKPRSIERQ